MINVEKMATEAEKRVKQLNNIMKTQDVIRKQREKLDAEEKALMDKINVIIKDKSVRKVKSKDKVKVKIKVKHVRAISKTGETLSQILLRVTPSSKEDGISKGDLASIIASEGYNSASSDIKVIIGQTVGKSDNFKSPERGKWQRSAKGDKAFAEIVTP